MFCDLVGSTGIAAKLDAEEWRDLVGAYLDAASVVDRRDGWACRQEARRRADGAVRLSGGAGERCRARCAWCATIRAGARRAQPQECQLRQAGAQCPDLLDAAPVAVDAAGEIFGDAPNVAARVQALAEPGAVLVTAQLQRQVARLFVAEERGAHELEGVPEPERCSSWCAPVAAAAAPGRASSRRSSARDEEMAMLMALEAKSKT